MNTETKIIPEENIAYLAIFTYKGNYYCIKLSDKGLYKCSVVDNKLVTGNFVMDCSAFYSTYTNGFGMIAYTYETSNGIITAVTPMTFVHFDIENLQISYKGYIGGDYSITELQNLDNKVHELNGKYFIFGNVSIGINSVIHNLRSQRWW